MEILELVDKLEAMAAQARKMPITGRAMLDAEKLLELTDQMRLSIPRNLHEAEEVLERREQIVSQTMIDARRLRATAEGDARALVDESELVKSARLQADDILEEAGRRAERIIAVAEQEARRRRDGADQYCQQSLEQLEGQVTSVLNTIHAGQRLLTPITESAPAEEPAFTSI